MQEPTATDRLLFRRLDAADAERLLALESDPEVHRHLSRTPPTPEDVAASVRRVLAEYEQGRAGRWLAFDRSGAFVGWFALDSAGCPPDERELAYRLVRRFWGQGLATEGGRAVLALAFGGLGLRRVRAQTMAVNLRSRAVLERLGLRHVRTFQQEFDDPLPGTEQGEVEYEILAAEWRVRR